MNDSKLCKKFINGLLDYNLTLEDMIRFKYIGGDWGSHLNYYKLCKIPLNKPDKKYKCVCNTKIKKNCYITDNKIILVIGRCCINNFIIKKGRTCEDCNEPHRNYKINKCNNCKKNIFINKHKFTVEKSEKKIKNNNDEPTIIKKCFDCIKIIKNNYLRCYNCNINYKNYYNNKSL